MIVGRHIDHLDERVFREFDFCVRKYPQIAFNVQTWEGCLYTDSTKKNILLATEAIATLPRNYDINWIRSHFSAVISYSDKFKENNPELKVYSTHYPPNWESYHWLEDFKGYDGKIRGICSLQHFYNTGNPFDSNYMKHKIMAELETEPHLVLHTYGQVPFGKPDSYQGYLGHRHSNYNNLKKINEYLFCVAVECMDDPFWGHDYLTERVMNTFKSKTVLVYYGAYNVKEILPDNSYVNVRDFATPQELSGYLISLSYNKRAYTEIINAAYDWVLRTTIGDMRSQEEVWIQAIRENPL